MRRPLSTRATRRASGSERILLSSLISTAVRKLLVSRLSRVTRKSRHHGFAEETNDHRCIRYRHSQHCRQHRVRKVFSAASMIPLIAFTMSAESLSAQTQLSARVPKAVLERYV